MDIEPSYLSSDFARKIHFYSSFVHLDNYYDLAKDFSWVVAIIHCGRILFVVANTLYTIS